MTQNYTTGHSTARSVSKKKRKYTTLEALEPGDHFKTTTGLMGVLLGVNFSYANVLIYAVPKFEQSTYEFAEELSKYYLGRLQIAPDTQVKHQKGAYDVKETNPNIRVQTEEYDNE